MLVKDIMIKKVITCSPKETINSVLNKMEKHNLHQLPVIDGELKGIITLNRIIKHKVDPLKAKVKSLMISAPTISPYESIDKAIELILNSNLRAIPVYDTKLRGIISEEDLISNIKVSSIEGKKCIYVNENDTIGKVRKLMYENDVSRIPVMGGNRFVGIVRSFDFIKFLRAKQKYELYASGVAEEKMRMDDILVKTIMTKPSVAKKMSAREIMKRFKGNEDVIVNGYIITPKDILRAYIKNKKVHSNIVIIGIEEGKEEIQMECENLVNKISHAVDIQLMKIHIEQHHGKKKNYSVRIQLVTNLGTFVSTKASGWNCLSVVQKSLKKIEREFWKRYKRIK